MPNDDDDYGALQNPASPYDNKNSKTPPAKAPAGKAPGANGEVTILAYYDWDPPISEEQEVKYLLDGKWHPSYPDYVEITGITVKNSPGDFIALMGMIAEYKPKSIKRLNFWTHSNRTVIGIGGHVVPGNVIFTNAIDDVTISNYAAARFFHSGQTNLHHRRRPQQLCRRRNVRPLWLRHRLRPDGVADRDQGPAAGLGHRFQQRERLLSADPDDRVQDVQPQRRANRREEEGVHLRRRLDT